MPCTSMHSFVSGFGLAALIEQAAVVLVPGYSTRRQHEWLEHLGRKLQASHALPTASG